MFWFSGKKRVEKLEEDIKKSFNDVRTDFDDFAKWIKHLHGGNKQLNDHFSALKSELSTIQDELEDIKEAISLSNFTTESKQLFKKQTAVYEQTAVQGVSNAVQTPVQTAKFGDILKNLSANERLIVLTLLNTGEGMKLSYEDVAKLLGKERSTVRGQINAIKQKSEGLISELTEQNGKKRVYVREEIKEKLLKNAKVRVSGGKKREKSTGK